MLAFGGDVLKFAGLYSGGGSVGGLLRRSASRRSLLDSTLLFAGLAVGAVSLAAFLLHPLALLPWLLLWLAQQVGGVPEARLRSFRMMPSPTSPSPTSSPASRLLLSLQLGTTWEQSALGRAFTLPLLSPGDAVLVLWRAAAPQLPETISLVLQCCWQIQKKHGTRDTHVGQKLHLKIGTGADGSAVPRAQPWHSPVPTEGLPCQHVQGKRQAVRAGEARAPSLPASCQLHHGQQLLNC